jgi:hypothetical protein
VKWNGIAIKTMDDLFTTNKNRFIINFVLIVFNLNRRMDSTTVTMVRVFIHDKNNSTVIGMN